MLRQGASAQNVVAWGSNSHGQLNVPAEATNVVSVATGWEHSVALRSDGTVICWGAITNVPEYATNIVSIASGARHVLALRSDGELVVWGDNSFGQTSFNFNPRGFIAIAAAEFFNVALRADGSVKFWGFRASQAPSTISNVVMIAAGAGHVVAVRDDDTSVGWAENQNPYRLAARPLPLSIQQPLAIAAASTNNYALQADGTLSSWGYGTQPQIPAYVTNVVCFSVSTNCNLAVRTDGTVVSWGSGPLTNVPPSATNVIAVAAGCSHALAVTSDGSPHFLSPPAYRSSTAAASRLPLYARFTAAEPLSIEWRKNDQPIAGVTNSAPQLTAFVEDDTANYEVVVSNALGSATSAVSKVSVSSVSVWGDNAHRQRFVPAGVTNSLAVAAGRYHLLSLQPGGTVLGWGKNAFGQSTIPRSASNVVAIAAGGDHSIALRSNGTVVAWGRNLDGQTNVPASVSNIVAIAAGLEHSVAIDASGRVIAWGNNSYGQTNIPLYVRNVRSVAAGYYHNLAVRTDGSIVAWGTWDEFPIPAAATNVIAAAAGWQHNLALRADGTVVAWGDNSFGQSDVPSSATNIVAIAAGYHHSMALRSDGVVLAWGQGHLGVTAIPTALRDVSAIAVGEDFSVALVKSGSPMFTPSSATVTAHVNGRALLSTSVGGTQPLTYQWYFEGTAISGATSPYLWLENVQPGDGGTYTLVVSNGRGATNTFPITLVVATTPTLPAPIVTNVPPHIPFRLAFTVAGEPPLTYQWRHNGQNIEDSLQRYGAYTATLRFNTTDYEHSGHYELVASNASGSVTGLVAQLNVTEVFAWGENSHGQCDIPLTASNVVALAAGEMHSLALRSDGSVVGWGDNSGRQVTIPLSATGVVSIAGGHAHSLAARADGTVIAWGTNNTGQITVPIAATNISRVAAGGHFSIGLSTNGSTVRWGLPNSYLTGYGDLAAIDARGYTALAVRQDGRGAGSGVPTSWTNLSAVSAAGYTRYSLALQSNGNVLTYDSSLPIPSSVTNAIAIAAGPMDQRAAVRRDGTIIEWNEFSERHLRPNWGQATALSAGDGFLLALLHVGTNVNITSHPASRSLGIGQQGSFQVNATGKGPLFYQWFLNDSPLEGATNSNYSFTASPSLSGSYYVIVSNAFSVMTSQIAELNTLTAPIITTHPLSQTVLKGGTASFNVAASGSSPLGYQWFFNQSHLSEETNSTLQLSSITGENAGSYHVVVSNAAGTAQSEAASLLVLASFNLSITLGQDDASISFDPHSEEIYTVQYATNLSSPIWFDLVTITNISTGTIVLPSISAHTNGSHFYRLIGR